MKTERYPNQYYSTSNLAISTSGSRATIKDYNSATAALVSVSLVPRLHSPASFPGSAFHTM